MEKRSEVILSMYEAIFLLIGIGIGFFFAWLVFSDRLKASVQETQRLAALESELDRLRTENAALQVDKTRLEQEKLSLERERTLIEKNFKEISTTYQAQFADLASKILDDKSKGLEAKNSESLRPLMLHLENFVKKVADMEHQNTASQARLEKGLADVIKSTEKIDQSALHLTHAIKGEAVVRGSWGEETLKRILDAAGMKEDYYQQVSEEGKRVDVQVALPEDRWIGVDAKTIFNHYSSYFNAQDPKEKENFLAEHVKDVKKTINDLSSKKYYKKFREQGEKVQPDYTLMFVYPESALLAAVEADPDILNEAWKHNIALVSATSLMSTLKLVSKLWDIDKQNEYMEDFKEDVLKLVEKFNDFLVNFVKAENAVLNAADAMKVARGHIDGNRGAFLPVAQRIVDIYEVPLAKKNANLLRRMDYNYTGHRSRQSVAPEESSLDVSDEEL